MRLSENVMVSVELNPNTVYVYGLSKEGKTGITEYINLENSENTKGDDQKGNACMLPILLTKTTITTTTLVHLQY